MSDLKAQLIEEQEHLEKRLLRFYDYNITIGIKNNDPLQEELTNIQGGAMYSYNECLKARIKRL